MQRSIVRVALIVGVGVAAAIQLTRGSGDAVRAQKAGSAAATPTVAPTSVLGSLATATTVSSMDSGTSLRSTGSAREPDSLPTPAQTVVEAEIAPADGSTRGINQPLERLPGSIPRASASTEGAMARPRPPPH